MENKISYRCPRCKNENIIDCETDIYCPSCKLDFPKASLDGFDEDEILAIQELDGFRGSINKDE